MEILNQNESCPKCVLVDQIVRANETMIHEQIKLIKILTIEKDEL